MATSRHARRKAAKARALDKLERLAIAERSRRNAEIVRSNLNSPIARNYYAGIKSSAVLIVEGGALRGGYQRTRVVRS